MSESYTLRYPRRVLVRSSARLGLRVLMRLLTRTTVTGQENLPKTGPVILVGNHSALAEVLMMATYVPWQVEILGVGDIPIEPMFAPFAHAFGFIPVNRGSMDRRAMQMALDVLAQKGAVGIFPEGGVWEPGIKRAHSGVAWLSSKANAPLIPIGFGGLGGALGAAFALKRPRLWMHIGQMIAPIQENIAGKTRKQALLDGAAAVMSRVEALIPPHEKVNRIYDEQFALLVEVEDAHGQPVPMPDHLRIHQPEALAKFFHRPVLLRTLGYNLRLPVKALQQIPAQTDAARLADAAQVVLDYVKTNDTYFTYRFGETEGQAMEAGVMQLRDLARWAASEGYSLRVIPIRRYRQTEDGEEIVEPRVMTKHKL
ncbi:MAG: lysophospholipid acyltransferase family protein [bacterium]|nr:lysophospholipid acyltransferase family protein [bacterium]